MIKPVDATTTAAWDELDELADNAELDLRRAFADDPERAARWARVPREGLTPQERREP